MHRNAVAELLSAAGVSPEYIEKLALYGELVLLGNARCNLTAARTPEAIVPHIIDSLTFTGDIQGRLVDVGSGGGFPAIPIAVVTGAPITMIESTGKKAKFLERCLVELGLAGRVLTGRAETFALEEEHRAQYERATARALAVAPAVIEYLLPFLKIGGVAIMQRGVLEDAERSAASDAALVLGGELYDERALEGQKRILFVRKTRPTAWRFPRKNGIVIKKPLCM